MRPLEREAVMRDQRDPSELGATLLYLMEHPPDNWAANYRICEIYDTYFKNGEEPKEVMARLNGQAQCLPR